MQTTSCNVIAVIDSRTISLLRITKPDGSSFIMKYSLRAKRTKHLVFDESMKVPVIAEAVNLKHCTSTD